MPEENYSRVVDLQSPRASRKRSVVRGTGAITARQKKQGTGSRPTKVDLGTTRASHARVRRRVVTSVEYEDGNCASYY